MCSAIRNDAPPDQAQRDLALDPRRSILVHAPAGSGKTTLLVHRFLHLLAEVDEPGRIVAITFTKPAAAEMRNRILDELKNPEPGPAAQRALERSRQLGWNLLHLPAQLRIQTIDSFCRDLALQRPLLSGLGGSLEIFEQPTELYRRATRRTLEQIDNDDAPLREAIAAMLLWRDNNWRELEDLVVAMLATRDRWIHGLVPGPDPDWDALRALLEQPFLRAAGGDGGAARYTEQEWGIVKACFTLLKHAAAELRVVFAEANAADFIEVAQIALSVLKGEDELPVEGALGAADRIRHLLVDEFQDTSRRQHEFLAHLMAAWTEREGRTLFVVGDPLQSIYGFRDADAELFPRVAQLGLEIPDDQALRLDLVRLTANFRTAEPLVAHINEMFARIFAIDDGSGLSYEKAETARGDVASAGPLLVVEEPSRMQLHVEFMPETVRSGARGFTRERREKARRKREAALEKQIAEIVELIRRHLAKIEEARRKNEKYRVAVLGRARTALEPVARALRDAGIPFRAVDLEELKERPEIIDALALARALLNPEDRVAWLGVLRAPWCGLSLADLHTLTSGDDAEIVARPVPQLMAERAALLSTEGRAAVERVLRAVKVSRRLRANEPAATTGTWLEQVWRRLGGAHCVDATERANLDLLWKSLDQLPEGEPDLFGSALDAALEDLMAQPDPGADSNRGVQLMTIHAAKGLEFEVVIVPELQARTASNKQELLSWLERGVVPDDDEEEFGPITEFLVAPVQAKGTERGKAKAWVDRIQREREKQETRRLFYVAATRAREELHLFARVSYKTAQNGSLTLAKLEESLLKTAWPALEANIERRFASWCVEAAATAQPLILDSVAATEDANVIEMPAPPRPTCMRRLPAQFAALPPAQIETPVDDSLVGMGELYERHEGGLRSRLLGKAVHALLEELARIGAAHSAEAPRVALARVEPRIAAQMRASGVEPNQASQIARQAIEIVLEAAGDPNAQWILSPHADAANEVRWTGVVDGSLRTVQVDRVFRAGDAPGTATASLFDSTWWIVDYKTAHEEGVDSAAALPELRRVFAPQVEAYGRILRNLFGADVRVCAGLYYPRMRQFDWWKL